MPANYGLLLESSYLRKTRLQCKKLCLMIQPLRAVWILLIVLINKFFTSVGISLRSLLPTLNVSKHCDHLFLTPRVIPDFVFKDIPVSFVHKELSLLCVNKSSGLKDIHSQGSKLRLTGHQCDQKLSTGD